MYRKFIVLLMVLSALAVVVLVHGCGKDQEEGFAIVRGATS